MLVLYGKIFIKSVSCGGRMWGLVKEFGFKRELSHLFVFNDIV